MEPAAPIAPLRHWPGAALERNQLMKCAARLYYGQARQPSEGKSQAGQEGAVAWEVGGQVQWIELVVLVGKVQDAQTHFRESARKAVADKDAELPEIISGNVGTVVPVGLLRPERVELAEKAGAVVEQREEIDLVQCGRFIGLGARSDGGRNVRKISFEVCIAQPIARAYRPLVCDQLV